MKAKTILGLRALSGGCTLAIMLASTAVSAQVAATASGADLPPAWPTPFHGTMAPELDQSRADWPKLPEAPAGAPNVLLIMTDDTGFGAASTFGGPVATPNLDRLASHGLRYNQFHTTAMCSPTRAALLTGRNHHSVGTGALSDFADGFPGYNSFMPRSAATVAQVLNGNGYTTAWFGKDHNIPTWQISPTGPFDQWPTSIGFDYFYGFVGADTDQWHPNLFRGTSRVADQGGDELLDKRLADDAIDWIHNVKAASPDKPFFVYYAPGSTHTPHQTPADWIARYKGKFDAGWDAIRAATFERQKAMGLIPADARLSKWPDDIPRWNTLSPQAKQVQAKYMEVYAAMLSYQDAQIGRILDELQRMGILENTLVIFIEGDNGADAAGGMDGELSEIGELVNKRSTMAQKAAMLPRFGSPDLQLNYSSGWAVTMDTPFPYYKQIASHLGGTRNGMVISWPSRIHDTGIRSQYHHVIDVAPTILEATGVAAPRSVDGVVQKPIDGTSMVYTFDAPNVPSHRQTQYYEMLGNRAIYHNGWLAATLPVKEPWDMMGPNADVNLAQSYKWALFNLKSDFTQTRDLAASKPAVLAKMEALFDEQARKFDVYPLDDRSGFQRIHAVKEQYVNPRDHYEYWGKGISLTSDVSPSFAAKSFTLDATVVPATTAETGVIAALGSRFAGWSLYLDKGHPTVSYVLSELPGDRTVLRADRAIPAGTPSTITLEVTYDEGRAGKGATIVLRNGGTAIATKHIDRTFAMPAGLGETFDVGLDRGITVSDDYPGAGIFSGDIPRLIVDLHDGAPAAARP